MSDYDWWQKALAGEQVGGPSLPIHDGEAHCGFFRRRVSRAGAFVPVAIWRTDDGVICLVDGRPADPADEWSYCCRHPITEAQYHQRMETGKWHDESDAVGASLAHVTDTNNPPTDEAEVLKGQIDAAAAGAAEYGDIRDDETASKAQSLRSRLLELSGDADKKREALKKPFFEAGKAVDAKFQPLVKAAKAAADTIRDALGAHETRKARAAEELRRKAEEDARKAAEEAARLAAKAEKAGKPIPAPAPAPPPPEPAPAPALAIRGAYGRGASVKVVKIAIVSDQDAAYGYLKTQPDLAAVIQKLAQKAVDAGLSVPGVTIEEQRKVS